MKLPKIPSDLGTWNRYGRRPVTYLDITMANKILFSVTSVRISELRIIFSVKSNVFLDFLYHIRFSSDVHLRFNKNVYFCTKTWPLYLPKRWLHLIFYWIFTVEHPSWGSSSSQPAYLHSTFPGTAFLCWKFLGESVPHAHHCQCLGFQGWTPSASLRRVLYISHNFVDLQKISHYFTIVFALWFSITFLLTVLNDCHTAHSTENTAHHLSSLLSEDLQISLYWV